MASNSLGTAWIQIKPSLSGVSNDIKKELQGATVYGTSTMASQFKGVFSGLGKNIYNEFSGAFNKVAATTKGIFATGIGTGIGLLTTQISSAVSRIDTLNNAPRVFEAMGYSIDSVNNSMSFLNDYLDGLPTTLDGAVRNVQNLAASFGGLDNGTKYFKALNDAGLAFGASSEMIDNAIMQLSQTSLDGPLDAQTWNSLRNSGFEPVFSALAQQAGKTVGELKKDFSADGTKTVQDFLNSLVELDEKGGGSMKSLEEMARANTDGIATSWKNAKTAITRGVADIIKSVPNLSSSLVTAGRSIEKVLKGNMGFDEASENIKTALQNILGAIGETLQKIIPLVATVLPDIVSGIVDGIVNFLNNQEAVSKVIDGFVRLFTAVAVGAVKIVNAIIPLIPQIIKTFAEEISKEENRGYIIEAFGLLFGVSVFKTIAGNLGKILKNTIGSKINDFFKTDIAKKGSKEGVTAIETLGNKLSSAIKGISTPLKTAIKELGEILGTTVTSLMEPIKAVFKGVGEALAGFFSALADPAIAVGAAMFAVAAAAIAAAILLIGGAIGIVMPALRELFNDIIMPIADFIVNTVLNLIDTLTASIIVLTNEALIPLGTFLRDTLVIVIQTIESLITGLTNNAIVPLVNTLSGAFTDVMRTVADLLTNVISAALGGVRDIVLAVGSAFESMGRAIRNVIDGVTGIINAFGAIIQGVADAVVAIIAIANNRNISYGPGYAYVWGAATGGMVGGDGTQFSDSNLFALSKGEYVIRASAARQIGYDNLDRMNETGAVGAGQINNNFTINGYNKDPNELADIISRKIALKTRGVY